MKERTRMNPDERRTLIMQAAMKEAEKNGFDKVRRVAIARRVDCSESLVRHYFETLPQLQRQIMGEAIRTENLRVIAQGLVAKHPRCKKLPDDLKQKALSSI